MIEGCMCSLWSKQVPTTRHGPEAYIHRSSGFGHVTGWSMHPDSLWVFQQSGHMDNADTIAVGLGDLMFPSALLTKHSALRR